MTVKELIEMLKTCDEKSEVKVGTKTTNTTLTCLTGFVLQWAKYGLKK